VYGCITSAKYNSTADLLEQQVSQDSTTREIVRDWSFTKTFSCYPQSIFTDAVSDAASGKRLDKDYEEFELIKIRTQLDLQKRNRVTNIRDSAGNVVWTEDNLERTPTIFEVQGTTPIFDMFNTLIEYEALLKRVEIQIGN
jgi:hypothetical protein